MSPFMAQSCRLPRCNDLVGYSGYFCRGNRRVCLPPNIDLHHFIERDAILAAVVELRGAGGGMRRHLARLLKCAASSRMHAVDRDSLEIAVDWVMAELLPDTKS